MKTLESTNQKGANRRSFLKNGIAAASAVTVGAGMLSNGLSALGAKNGGGITEGDAAVLRFLAAAEILETDLWQQYNELGGVDAPPSAYQTALQQLDGDMPQYIADNTDDEESHELFINAYLISKGAKPVSLEQFRTLEGSEVTAIPGIDGKKRLTNLMRLAWTPVGGLGIAAGLRTQISVTPFRMQFLRWPQECSQQFRRTTPNSDSALQPPP